MGGKDLVQPVGGHSVVRLDAGDVLAGGVAAEDAVGSGGDGSLVHHGVPALARVALLLAVGLGEDVVDLHGLVEVGGELHLVAVDEVAAPDLH